MPKSQSNSPTFMGIAIICGTAVGVILLFAGQPTIALLIIAMTIVLALFADLVWNAIRDFKTQRERRQQRAYFQSRRLAFFERLERERFSLEHMFCPEGPCFTAVDFEAGKIAIDRDGTFEIFDHTQLLNADLETDQKVDWPKGSSMLASGAIGGLLLGGTGVIAGMLLARGGNPSEKISKLIVDLSFASDRYVIISVPFYDGPPIDPGDIPLTIKAADEFVDTLGDMIKYHQYKAGVASGEIPKPEA